jgi:hypothetical protein
MSFTVSSQLRFTGLVAVSLQCFLSLHCCVAVSLQCFVAVSLQCFLSFHCFGSSLSSVFRSGISSVFRSGISSVFRSGISSVFRFASVLRSDFASVFRSNASAIDRLALGLNLASVAGHGGSGPARAAVLRGSFASESALGLPLDPPPARRSLVWTGLFRHPRSVQPFASSRWHFLSNWNCHFTTGFCSGVFPRDSFLQRHRLRLHSLSLISPCDLPRPREIMPMEAAPLRCRRCSMWTPPFDHGATDTEPTTARRGFVPVKGIGGV